MLGFICLTTYQFQLCLADLRGVEVNVLDRGIVISDFELQSHYYAHYRTNTLGNTMNPFISHAMD